MAQGDQYFLTSGAGEKIELTGELSIGRSTDCDLVLTEGQPSRQHARLVVDDDGVTVEDLNSTNGTYINGERISGARQLNNGDKVAFDVNEYGFQVDSPVREDATVLRQIEDPNRTVMRAIPSKEDLEAEIARDAEIAKEAQAKQAAEAAREAEAAQAAKEAQALKEAEAAKEAQAAREAEVAKQEAQAAAAEAAPAPEPAPEPPAPEPAPEPKAVKPGSWADPNEKNASSTQFFSPEDLAAMRAGSGGGEVQDKVESDVPYLQVVSGSAVGSIIQLITDGDKKEWSIGGDAARDIVFTDQGVSDFHTILAVENGRWKVVDQMSTNGTFVNGAKTVSAYLNSGDTIRVGTVECALELPGGSSSKRSAKSSSAGEAGGGSKTVVGVTAFVFVLALMFGAYFFLM